MKERMDEVILKAADLRMDCNDLKDSISKSDEIIANLRIELSMANIERRSWSSWLVKERLETGVV